jgi:small-conductance mechanosensitive channel
MKRYVFLFVTAFVLLAASNTATFAQAGSGTAPAAEIKSIQKELKLLLDGAKFPGRSSDDFGRIEQQTGKLRARMANTGAKLDKRLKQARADLKDIGPKPKDPQVKEAAEIAKQRATAQKRLKALIALKAHITALDKQAVHLIERIGAVKRSRFFQQLFSRQRTPFSGLVWSRAGGSAEFELRHTFRRIADWYDSRARSGKLAESVAFFAVVIVLLAAFLIYLRGRFRAWLFGRFEQDEATPQTRLAFACLLVLIDFVCLGSFAFVALRQALVENLVAPSAVSSLRDAAIAVILVFVVAAISRHVRATGAYIRYLGGEGGILSARAYWPLVATAALFGADLIVIAAVNAAGASVFVNFIATFVYVVATAAIMVPTVFRLPPGRTDRPGWGDGAKARLIAGMVCALALLAEMIGFLSFGRYLIRVTLMLVMLWAVLSLLRAAIHEAIARAAHIVSGTRNGETPQDAAPAITSVVPWLALLSDLVLLFWAGLLALMAGGLGWSEVSIFLVESFSGIKIGSLTFSLSAMLTAAGVFIAVIVLARLFQNYVRRRIFPETGTSVGMQESIISVIRYGGLVIALLMAIVTLGVDFSNIAIIAGALSVGIGFGLQSIANNFVSGLILLFERPIKVGDWVVTNSGEGWVKKIGVRSTEIETFDRSSLLIPNSEFITATVKNWTHRSRMRRVDVAVGVSYDADPKQVADLLLETVKEIPDLLKAPPPRVMFKDYGESSIDFEIQVFIRNAADYLVMLDRIRHEVWDALAVQGIEIPYPQRDLHIKSQVPIAAGAKKPKG